MCGTAKTGRGEADDFDCCGVAIERTDIAVVAADDLTWDRSLSPRCIPVPWYCWRVGATAAVAMLCSVASAMVGRQRPN